MTSHRASDGDLDRDSWERRWTQALGKGAHSVAQRPPNVHLLAEVAGLRRGRALDAGAGHGAETLWLALRGWRVTAVDFSATALEYARSRAEGLGTDVATDGTLLLVGHQPTDPITGEAAPAAGQVQVSVAGALAGLDPERWHVVVAEERRRELAGCRGARAAPRVTASPAASGQDRLVSRPGSSRRAPRVRGRQGTGRRSTGSRASRTRP